MLTLEAIKAKIRVDHFVGGERVKALSQETYTSLNPANNEPIATFALGNREDIDRAVQAARKAFDQGAWPRLPIKERSRILSRFANLIEKNSDLLGAIESYDVGKLLQECIGHDVARASANIRFYASKMEQWQDEAFFNEAAFLGKKITTLSVTRRDPVGVAGLIVPWNSPIMLATWKIGPCLAAGNTCVVKPTPWALLSILQLGEIANEAGIPEGVLNIVPGGVEAGEALVSHPAVDRISFTGSVGAGKAVNQANAQARLAPVVLELGGKSPSIVFADADLDLALKGVARGIFRSQGQSCVADSRLLLERSICDDFLKQLVESVGKMKIGDPISPDTQIGPLITKEHLQRVKNFITAGIEEGAKLTLGGKRPVDPALKNGNYIEPTIFENVTPEMEIWRKEIFGPVLVVMPFKTEEEAIAKANNSSFGLSSTVWTTDFERALSVAGSIESGMTWINSHFVRDLRSPFGGIKDSGVGSEGGRYSLEFYTKPKMMCLSYPR